MTPFYVTRSQAAKAAQRAGHPSFRTIRFPSHGWKYEVFNGKCDEAHAYAKTVDFVHHVEVDHIDEGRAPGYRGVLIVTCLPEELPADLPFAVEPITPELFADKAIRDSLGKGLTTGATGVRAKSDIESPTKVVWRIADEMKGEPKSAIVARCVEAGVNESTASTQFYKWRKANNA